MRNHRLILVLVALVAVAPATAQAAFTPNLDASISGGSATPGQSEAAVCTVNDADDVALAVTATSTFSSNDTSDGALSGCSNCNGLTTGSPQKAACETNGASARFRSFTRTTVTVTEKTFGVGADDGGFGHSTALAGGPPAWSGTLANPGSGNDGEIGVTFTATGSEKRTTQVDTHYKFYTGATNCTNDNQTGTTTATYVVSGSPSVTTPTVQKTTSASYLLDLDAPTLEHDVPGAPLNVAQNGTVSYDLTAKGGSSSTGYSMKATASGPASLESTDGPFTFGAGTGGVAPDVTKAVGLVLGCDPLGTYTSGGELAAVDLCGDSWGTVSSSTAPADEFTVTADASCAGLDLTTVVTAPLVDENYQLVECFTSHKAGRGKNKTVAGPGTVHVGAVVNLPAGDGDCDDTVSGLELTLTKPSIFDWTMSGGSPAAHVFVGDASGGFFYHSGAPLVEVTDALRADGRISGGTSNANNDIDVDLSNLDVGCGAGELPHGWTVYARAHVRFSRSAAIGTDLDHVFWSSVTSNEFVGPYTDDHAIEENPTAPVCINGSYDE